MEGDVEGPVQPGDIGQIRQAARCFVAGDEGGKIRAVFGQHRLHRQRRADEGARQAAEKVLADQRLHRRKGGGQRRAEALEDMMAIDAQPRRGRDRIAHDRSRKVGAVAAPTT